MVASTDVLVYKRCYILLSHTCKRFYAIAEGVRRKRQDIYRLLSKFVNDVDGFRRLMKKTGGIIVGDMASAFFTSATLQEVSSLDLVLYNVDLETCVSSWFSFLEGETNFCWKVCKICFESKGMFYKI